MILKFIKDYLEKKTMKNIIEISIENQHVSAKKQWEVIVALHDTILHADKNWHFFYEVFFNIVRVSKKYVPLVIDVLDEFGMKYEVKGPWVDNQPITKKHQKNFKSIFHEQSELIMKIGKLTNNDEILNEIWFLGDRMIHCFLNNCNYVAEPWKEEARAAASWENYITTRMASCRTSYNKEFVQANEKAGIDFSEFAAEYGSSRPVLPKKIDIKTVNPLKKTEKTV